MLCHCRCCYFYCSLFSRCISNSISILMLFPFSVETLDHYGWHFPGKKNGFHFKTDIFREKHRNKNVTWFWRFIAQQGIDIRNRCSVGIVNRCSWPVDWCCHFCITSTASRQLCKYTSHIFENFDRFGFSSFQERDENIIKCPLANSNHIISVGVATNLAYNFSLHAKIMLFAKLTQKMKTDDFYPFS